MDESPQFIAKQGSLWVVSKPSGWAVHPARGLEAPDLVSWARGQDRDVAPVHRLDRDTSGVVLLSPDAGLRAQLGQAFADGLVQKTYRALVAGVPPKGGTIRRPLMDRRRGRKLSAETRFRRIEVYGGFAYLELEPHTGRRHQLRRHLRGLGHPIVGDRRYGPRHPRSVPGFPGRLWLHALRLVLPDGTAFEAPLPAVLQDHLTLLAADGTVLGVEDVS